MIDWHEPSVWMLWLLVLVPLAGWWLYRPNRHASVTWSNTDLLSGLGSTWRSRLCWLPGALRLTALTVLIIALARPREGNEQTQIFSEGVAIQMLVDRSGSMEAMDFQLAGRPVNRLEAIKDVAGKFVNGGEQLTGRDNDLVGLVTFARYADNASPLTLDHQYLVGKLSSTQIVKRRSEDGTAIGEAIGLAVERLAALSDSREGKKSIKSKVIILLTDGENNAGELDPVQAAELASTQGIRIYTIGVGTKGLAPVPVIDPFSGRRVYRRTRVNIDEATLTKVARQTGGKYFRATDTDSLKAIYAEIDQLEKSKLEAKHYMDYRELAIDPIHAGPITLPPLLLIAFGLVALEMILQHTLLRRVP